MKTPSMRHFLLASLVTITAAHSAAAATYALPPADQSLIGAVQTITAARDTTLSDVARDYNVGFNAIRAANPGVDPWLPAEGAPLVVPTRYILPDTPRRGIVLNVPEMRLYYYPRPVKGAAPQVMTFPVSIGRGDWETPLGLTKVIAKTPHPAWYPPDSVRAEHAAEGNILPRVVPAGPNNPLGQFALRLGLPGYLIHGTNKPYGIGMRVSHGCVRLYPEDIKTLFHDVPVGAPVRIIHQPYKLSHLFDTLYLEAHPPLTSGFAHQPNLEALLDAVDKANQTLAPGFEIDFRDAIRIATNPSGIPQPVRVIRKPRPHTAQATSNVTAS